MSRRILGASALGLACGALVVLPPTIALAGHTGDTHATYATAVGNTGVYPTTSWNGRSFNRAWHAAGWQWAIWYLKTDGSTSGHTSGTGNPTANTYTASYAKSVCWNIEDGGANSSGVRWTCETNTSN